MADNTGQTAGGATPRLLRGWLAYAWLFAALFLLYLLIAPHVALSGNGDTAYPSSALFKADEAVRTVMAAFIFLLLAAALIGALLGRMTAERLLVFIVLAGLALRFGYMLYTPFYARGHDVSVYGGGGHLDYIVRLFDFKGLPDANHGQFYHPPLAHLAGAAVARLYALITGASDRDVIFNAARLVPCFASGALLVVCARLFDALDFSRRAKTVAMAVVAFHPTFMLLSASINNDMLMILFFMSAFLYTVRWQKDPSYKNTLLLALSIGCAMSTKFSGALIAVFTAVVFLSALIRKFVRGGRQALFGRFAAFAAVCVPLGLWYPLRNFILFSQPLGYVARIPVESGLYVGHVPMADRFLTFNIPTLFKNVWCNPWEDYNLWEYTVRSALFGEFTFSDVHRPVAAVLIALSLMLIALSLLTMVWFVVFEWRKSRRAVLSFAGLWALTMASFVYFNFQYPFGCTMDFRYIVPTVVTGAAFLGLMTDKLTKNRKGRALFKAFCAVLGAFCAAVAVFFVL